MTRSQKRFEIQGLDIQVSEKKIREFGFEITSKTQVYEKALADLEARKSDLDAKKAELGTITAETEKDESELTAQAEKAIPKH
jgi:predicted  nucleic acid-binding Zn-ribbon protein